jgi:hypothetical protein
VISKVTVSGPLKLFNFADFLFSSHQNLLTLVQKVSEFCFVVFWRPPHSNGNEYSINYGLNVVHLSLPGTWFALSAKRLHLAVKSEKILQ